ncbi:hypothetical protein Syun_023731 [Stephania yunnanensis]|uniref:At1g61320/AtMIF1 LRR domain-containing protein n=1 Tax=Stephania yunnanensis TaxID=152371 RepID=A0AAP0FCY9_9MAGN
MPVLVHNMEWKIIKMGMTEEDRISQLPDHILTSMLSSLSIRQAVGTSVLSSRWRDLWIRSISTIDFHPDNLLDAREYDEELVNRVGKVQMLIISCKRLLNFILSGNQFLRQLPVDHKISKFRMNYPFRRNRYGLILDQWIHFAISRGVEELDVDLLSEGCFDYAGEHGDHVEAYDFPCDGVVPYSTTSDASNIVLPSLKRLRLNGCIFSQNNLSNFFYFTSLEAIDLQHIDFQSGATVETLLPHCPNLKWLSFYQCTHIFHIHIRRPLTTRLKYLSVKSCFDVNEIEIDGVELATFEYSGNLPTFSFKEVPLLLNVYFCILFGTSVGDGTVLSLPKLLETLPQLEKLLLRCCCDIEAEELPERLPTFQNLKHLAVIEIKVLSRNLMWIAQVLKASPLLQNLELHLDSYDYQEEPKEIERPPRVPLDHLKEVVISGAHGYLSEIELAIYVLNNAVILERMTIDPYWRHYLGDGKWQYEDHQPEDLWTRARRDKWAKIGRQRVLDYLQQEVPPDVELIVL